MSIQKIISVSCTSTPSIPEGQVANYIITIVETADDGTIKPKETFTENRASVGPNKTDVLHQASSVFEGIIGRTLKESQWCGKSLADNITVSLNNNNNGTYTYTLTATVRATSTGEKSYTNFTHRGAMSSNLINARNRREAQDNGTDGNNGFVNIKSKTADSDVKKTSTEISDSSTKPTLYIVEYFYSYNDKTYKCPAASPTLIPQDPSINNAQYFRQVSEGNVAIEGRSSNAVILDNNGNTYLVSGMNDTEKQELQKQNYQGTLNVNGNNSSYIAIKTKDENPKQEAIVLGSNNYQTFNEKLNQDKDPNLITTPNPSLTPQPSPSPLPTQETPIPTPTPTPIISSELEEGETIIEFLPEREDQQEFNQLFDVAPIIGIVTAGVSFNGVEIKNGKSYSITTKSLRLSGNAKQKIKKFFDLYKTETLDSSDNDYVFPEVTMAQAILESGYGNSVINTGNFFGITRGGWKGDYGIYKTREGNANTRVNTSIGEENLRESAGNGLWWYKRAFRHYKTVAEGFKDHNKILKNPTYYKGYDEQGTPEKQVDVIAPSYATGADYAAKVNGVIAELKPLFAGTYNVLKEGNKYKIIVNR